MKGLSYHREGGYRLPDRNSEYINSHTQVGAHPLRTESEEERGGTEGERDRVESDFEGHILGSYA